MIFTYVVSESILAISQILIDTIVELVIAFMRKYSTTVKDLVEIHNT